MTWFRVDDKLHSHPKRHAASLRALGLWTLAGSWSGDQLTDGHIPAVIVKALGGTTTDAASLVNAGLWERVDGGYQFRDWADHNPSRKDVQDKRNAEREKKQRWREKARRDAATGKFEPTLKAVSDD